MSPNVIKVEEKLLLLETSPSTRRRKKQVGEAWLLERERRKASADRYGCGEIPVSVRGTKRSHRQGQLSVPAL